jgi:hypothetical protein
MIASTSEGPPSSECHNTVIAPPGKAWTKQETRHLFKYYLQHKEQWQKIAALIGTDKSAEDCEEWFVFLQEAFSRLHCDPSLQTATADKVYSGQAQTTTPNDDKVKRKRFRRKATQIERLYRCQEKGCNRSYGTEGALKMHLKLKHPNVKYNASYQLRARMHLDTKTPPSKEDSAHPKDSVATSSAIPPRQHIPSIQQPPFTSPTIDPLMSAVSRPTLPAVSTIASLVTKSTSLPNDTQWYLSKISSVQQPLPSFAHRGVQMPNLSSVVHRNFRPLTTNTPLGVSLPFAMHSVGVDLSNSSYRPHLPCPLSSSPSVSSAVLLASTPIPSSSSSAFVSSSLSSSSSSAAISVPTCPETASPHKRKLEEVSVASVSSTSEPPKKFAAVNDLNSQRPETTCSDASEAAKTLLDISIDIHRVEASRNAQLSEDRETSKPPTNIMSSDNTLTKRVAFLLSALNREILQTPLRSRVMMSNGAAVVKAQAPDDIQLVAAPDQTPPLSTGSHNTPLSSLSPDKINGRVPNSRNDTNQNGDNIHNIVLDSKNSANVPSPILPSFIPTNRYLFPESTDCLLRKNESVR